MRVRTRAWIPVAAAVAAAAALLWPAPTAKGDPGPEVHEGVVFSRPDGSELLLDLARPAGAPAATPAIVVIHGGGWAAGNRRMHRDLIRRLADRGYVAATVDYRLAPRHVWPAQIHDAKAAVRFLRANAARYGIDAGKIGAMGFSAGGHLAMMLGATGLADGLDGAASDGDASCAVQAVVSWFGPTQFDASDLPERARRFLDGLLGPAFARDPGAASPLRYVDRADAPMLLIHGTKDVLVPVSQATAMAEAMTRAGTKGQVLLLLGENHGWLGSTLADTFEDSVRFFDRHLRGLRAPRPS